MAVEHTLETPLAEAVRAAGSQSAFARMVGRRQSTVASWLLRNQPLPAELVLTVEQSTGVSRHDLRPDVFPADRSNDIPILHPDVASDRAEISDGRVA